MEVFHEGYTIKTWYQSKIWNSKF